MYIFNNLCLIYIVLAVILSVIITFNSPISLLKSENAVTPVIKFTVLHSLEKVQNGWRITSEMYVGFCSISEELIQECVYSIEHTIYIIMLNHVCKTALVFQ